MANNFILFSALHGFVITLILFYKKNDHNSNKILAFLLFIFSVYLLEYCLFNMGYLEKYPHLLLITYPSIYFIGPLIYLYQKKTAKERMTRIHRILILGLPILIYILFIPYYMLNAQTKFSGEWFRKDPELNYLHLFLNRHFFIIYTLAFIILAYGNITKIQPKQSHDKALKITLLTFITTLMFSAIIDFFDKAYSSTLITILLILSLHFIAYGMILSPSLFSGPNKSKKNLEIKYRTSPLTKSRAAEIKQHFSDLLTAKKPYLNSEFDLESAASELNVPKHHLSQVINEEFNSTSPKIVKELRIKEAFLLIQDDKEFKKK